MCITCSHPPELREHFAYENNGEIRDDITLLGWLGWHPMKSLKLGCRNPCINLSGLGAFLEKERGETKKGTSRIDFLQQIR